ncbi:MAG: amidohydrolase family protein [Fimbriimonadaceae bacterium]|nr:amidohydrolase family protein [Fimbriimonadaceae bacterium]QYK58864.1 MAG: amidohydrolase family protein [Fimbriimonadaceae bacterium]
MTASPRLGRRGLTDSVVLRPQAVLVDRSLECGLSVEVYDGEIVHIGETSDRPDCGILSPAFVNAHSHLEYRGMAESLPGGDYTRFIREITQLKRGQSPESVQEDCRRAAHENRAAGVGYLAEHSDRPYSGQAMAEAGLEGVLFQEVLTVAEGGGVEQKLLECERRLDSQREVFKGATGWALHAPYTVDAEVFRRFARRGDPISVHVAESLAERDLFEHGTGPIADFLVSVGAPLPRHSQGPVAWLSELGVLGKGVQCVHVCAVNNADIEMISAAHASVAHCPSSNVFLACPVAPVKRLLDAGVTVGLGLDSAASGGAIDMFKEMRACLQQSDERKEPITSAQVWFMATTGGAESLGLGDWRIEVGSKVPMILIEHPGASSLDDLIARGVPQDVKWL